MPGTIPPSFSGCQCILEREKSVSRMSRHFGVLKGLSSAPKLFDVVYNCEAPIASRPLPLPPAIAAAARSLASSAACAAASRATGTR